MTSKTVPDEHWGERSLKQRNRRRWVINGAMVALGVAFVVGTRSLVATHSVTRPTTALIAVGFVLAITALGWASWRRNDEIQRRLSINAYAVMGVTCLVLIPLARGVGPMLGLPEPMLIAYVIAALMVPASVAFQWLRG